MIDFYSLLSEYWGVARKEAKTRIITFIDYEFAGRPINQLQPEVLDYIPSDARAELLSHYGVFVGDN